MKPLHLPAADNGRNLSSLDPLDSRYYDAEVAKYLSERSRVAYQAHVEVALGYTLADFGICSLSVAKKIEASSRKVSAEAVYEQESITKHDIKALVNCIKQDLDTEAQPYVHFGATSYDIIATANALQLRGALLNVVVPRLKTLLNTLLLLAERYHDTVQIGRTHGQHAVPVTFGFAISEYISRLGNSTQAIEDLCGMLQGKFSGAVGAYNALTMFVDDPLKFEAALLSKLKLKPAEYATQIVPPETAVRLIDELAIASGIMANLAHDMRHLQRSEIAEVSEVFATGQTGSSTMAHKRNPMNFENIVSMAKQVTAQIINANLNLASEHQRDLTDSASSRFYPLVPALVASMTQRLQSVMAKLEVDEAAMQRNLHLSQGAIAAEPLYLLFEKYGHVTAHEKSKNLAHQALASGKPLVEVITSDSEAAKYWQQFNSSEKRVINDPEQYYIGQASRKTKQIIAKWRKYATKWGQD